MRLMGLVCHVLKPAGGFPNCSNGGISSIYDEVTLVGGGVPELFEATEDAPAVMLCHRALPRCDTMHMYAKPLALGNQWSMFGGCFIYTSDSRFPAEYPIPLHDRVE